MFCLLRMELKFLILFMFSILLRRLLDWEGVAEILLFMDESWPSLINASLSWLLSSKVLKKLVGIFRVLLFDTGCEDKRSFAS